MTTPHSIDNPRRMAHAICVNFRPTQTGFDHEKARLFVDLAFLTLDATDELPVFSVRNVQGLRSEAAIVLNGLAEKSNSLLERATYLFPDKLATLVALFTANNLRDFCTFTTHAAEHVNRSIQGVVLPGRQSPTYLSEISVAAAANQALRERTLKDAYRSSLILPLGQVNTSHRP